MATCGQLKCPYIEICSFKEIIGIQTIQTLIWGGGEVFKIFVSFLGRLCKLPEIWRAGGTVRAILEVIQFLYLNSNVSLIITREASKAF